MTGKLSLRWECGESSYTAPISLPESVLEKLGHEFSGAGDDWRSMQRLLWLAAKLADPVAELAAKIVPIPTPNDRQLAWAYAKALNKKIPRAVLASKTELAQFVQKAEAVSSNELLQYLVLFDPNSVDMMVSVLD